METTLQIMRPRTSIKFLLMLFLLLPGTAFAQSLNELRKNFFRIDIPKTWEVEYEFNDKDGTEELTASSADGEIGVYIEASLVADRPWNNDTSVNEDDTSIMNPQSLKTDEGLVSLAKGMLDELERKNSLVAHEGRKDFQIETINNLRGVLLDLKGVLVTRQLLSDKEERQPAEWFYLFAFKDDVIYTAFVFAPPELFGNNRRLLNNIFNSIEALPHGEISRAVNNVAKRTHSETLGVKISIGRIAGGQCSSWTDIDEINWPKFHSDGCVRLANRESNSTFSSEILLKDILGCEVSRESGNDSFTCDVVRSESGAVANSRYNETVRAIKQSLSGDWRTKESSHGLDNIMGPWTFSAENGNLKIFVKEELSIFASKGDHSLTISVWNAGHLRR